MQDRRAFLRSTAALAAGPLAAQSNIPYRALGRTGEKVSIIGLGGAHLGTQRDPRESERIIRAAIDNGINFMDNSWDYHNGQSEIRMGRALRDGYRNRAFLMTKFDGRTKESAARQIDESLKRLQTDHIDLMQIHEVIRANDPDRIFAKGGAIEAIEEARKAGKIRYVGYTGHKSPEIHLKMLNACLAHNFVPDTVQMPLNVMDAHYDSFERKVLPQLQKHNIAVLAMKPMGGDIILQSRTVTPVECLQYAMSLPVATVITGCDSMKILEQALNTARGFKPLGKQQVAAILAKTGKAARNGEFEKYKTSARFDATSRHPEWLG